MRPSPAQAAATVPDRARVHQTESGHHQYGGTTAQQTSSPSLEQSSHIAIRHTNNIILIFADLGRAWFFNRREITRLWRGKQRSKPPGLRGSPGVCSKSEEQPSPKANVVSPRAGEPQHHAATAPAPGAHQQCICTATAPCQLEMLSWCHPCDRATCALRLLLGFIAQFYSYTALHTTSGFSWDHHTSQKQIKSIRPAQCSWAQMQ